MRRHEFHAMIILQKIRCDHEEESTKGESKYGIKK